MDIIQVVKHFSNDRLRTPAADTLPATGNRAEYAGAPRPPPTLTGDAEHEHTLPRGYDTRTQKAGGALYINSREVRRGQPRAVGGMEDDPVRPNAGRRLSYIYI